MNKEAIKFILALMLISMFVFLVLTEEINKTEPYCITLESDSE